MGFAYKAIDRGQCPRVRRLAIRVAAIAAAMLAPWSAAVGAADRAMDTEICAVAPGLQGRIEAVGSNAQAVVQVQRGDVTREVSRGCLLKAGDIVRPGAGTRVTVTLPDRKKVIVDDQHPLVVPEIRPASYLARVADLLRDWAGPDTDAARKLAAAKANKIGATRALRGPITMPGISGLGQQMVDGRRPLLVRWDGGAAPFRLQLAPGGNGHGSMIELAATGDRYARLDLRRNPLGLYDLIITGGDGGHLDLPIRLVASADVPAPREIDAADDQETRDLVEAVWLLTRKPEWRLYSLSLLEALARDYDNVVAETILDR